jgi:2-polyprenyl-3-methyl-5-hydroxy-6-metoxy-1,4-benzoquinol methylase
MASSDNEQAALQWQVGVWDRMSPIYLREVDDRFTEIIDGVIRRAALQPGQQVLDLGTGTGSVAVRAACAVMPGGTVTAMDISPRNAPARAAAGHIDGPEQHHISEGSRRGDTDTLRTV